jgi:hypothetical protein
VGTQDELVDLVVGAEEDDVVAQDAQQVLLVEEGLAEVLQPVVFAVNLPAVERLEAVVPSGPVMDARVAGGNTCTNLSSSGMRSV